MSNKLQSSITIIKLGGSFLTDKNTPNSVRKQAIESSIQQIIRATSTQNKKTIIVHGGGSFGHPMALEYQIHKGLTTEIPKQDLGLALTHHKMEELNCIILDKFLMHNFPVMSLPPASMFYHNSESLIFTGIPQIESLLELGVTPILYGDVLLHSTPNFSILSGDRIILELCKSLGSSKISKVIFVFDEEGLYVPDPQDATRTILKLNLTYSQLENLEISQKDPKIDVTGGIHGKLQEVSKIVALEILVQFLNGNVPNNLFKAIDGQKVRSTTISYK
ncbi:MAG: isopentenyl phosphate kinase [Promethearchaeota archaeon]